MKTVLMRFVTGLVTVLAANVASATVSVEEIIRLHTAGLSDHSLLLVVSASDTPDTLSTAQLTQMIEAQVPDTVISALVGKADAVMEDWQPVNLDEEMKGHTAYTETEVRYVYPSWDAWYGYGGWGWCGTPWYGWNYPWYGYGCATPYSGLYVGYGWGGGWSIGFNFGWGYPYYAPYYPYYGGGYCGWYDPYPYYDPYPGYYGDPYDSYRVVDRVDYHSGPSRDGGRSAPGTPYRQDAPADTRTELSRMEGRKLTTIDRSGNTTNGKTVRDQGGVPATRSVDDLTRVSAPGDSKSTVTSANRGDGRYVIKGDDKQLRENSGTTGRSLETVSRKSEKSNSLETPSTKSDRSVTGKVVRGLESGTEQRSSDLAGRVTETTRKVTSKAGGAESTGDKVNRYVKMKQSQKSTGGSRGSRSTASSARMAEAPSRDAASAPSQRSTSRSDSKPQVHRGESTKAPAKAAPSTRQSTPKSFSPKSGGSSSRSVGSAPRSGGSRSGGGSRSAGGSSRGGSGGGGGSRGGRR